MKGLRTRFGIVPLTFAIGLALGSALTGVAWAYQTHMQNALSSLNNAAYELNQAVSDKGGHRANALTYVNKAIQETKWGIEYANTH